MPFLLVLVKNTAPKKKTKSKVALSKPPNLEPQPPRPLNLPLLSKPLGPLQASLDLPLRPRQLPDLLPHLFKTDNVMPKQKAPAGNGDRFLIAHQTTHLHAHDQTPRLGLQQPRHARAKLDAGFKVPMVQEETQIHHVHLAIQPLQQQILVVENIGREEGALEALAVAEELEAEVHEFAVEVGTVDVLAVGAIGDELADILAEAAAEVEEGVVGVAEAGDEGGVVRGEVDG